VTFGEAFARSRFPAEIARYQEVIDPSVLTIGFLLNVLPLQAGNAFDALIWSGLLILMGNKLKVQFVIAGKAHPKTFKGKNSSARSTTFIRETEIEKQVEFPNYDIHVARLLAWLRILNTPGRPRKGSNVSGRRRR